MTMSDDLERRMREFLAAQEKQRTAEEERRIIERYGRAALEQKKKRTADLKADQYERRMIRRIGREAWEAEKKR
jgi:hypothetical protein